MRGRPPTWTPEQFDVLKALAGKRTTDGLLKRINALGPQHTYAALTMAAARYGISLRLKRTRRIRNAPGPRRRCWSPEEDAFVRARLGRQSVIDITAALNAAFRDEDRAPRSVATVRRRASTLGESLVRGDGLGMEALRATIGMSLERIHREVEAGRLRAEQQGNSHRGSLWLFLPADIEAWIKAYPYALDWRRVRQGRWRDAARAAALGAPHLSITEVSRYLGLDRKVVQRWVREKQVSGIRDIGTPRKPVYRIPLRALEQIERLAGTRDEVAA